jgi:hypothetical protein
MPEILQEKKQREEILDEKDGMTLSRVTYLYQQTTYSYLH